jgi:hypothetical protein
MRYHTVSHEDLLKSRREPSTHLIHPEIGQGREWPGADRLLSLAAAPTFAIMALLAGIQDGGMPGMPCSAVHDASPLTGMAVMYVLMSAFHSAPWLKLISHRRAEGPAANRGVEDPVIASDSEAIQTKPQLEASWFASLRSQ